MRKYLLFPLLLMVLLNAQLPAQNTTKDELVALLTKGYYSFDSATSTEDKQLRIANLDSTIATMNEAIPLALELDTCGFLHYAHRLIFLSHQELGTEERFIEYLPTLQNHLTCPSNETPAVLSGLGTAFEEKGDWLNAKLYFEMAFSAVGMLKGDERTSMLVDLNINIGDLYLDQTRDYDFAEDYYRHALALQNEVSDHYPLKNERSGNAQGNLARCLRMAKRYPEALHFAHAGLTSYLKDNDFPSTVSSLSELGAIYLKLEQGDSALSYFQAAQPHIPTSNPSLQFRNWVHQMNAYQSLGDEAGVQYCMDTTKLLLQDPSNNISWDIQEFFWRSLGEIHAANGDRISSAEAFAQSLFHLASLFYEKGTSGPPTKTIRSPRIAFSTLEIQLNTLFPDSLPMSAALDSDLLGLVTYTDSIIQQLRTLQLREGSRYHLSKTAKPIYEKGIQAAVRRYHASQDTHFFNTALFLLERSKALSLSEATRAAGPLPARIRNHPVWTQKRDAAIRLERLNRQLLSAPPAEVPRLENQRFELQSMLDSLDQALKAQFPRYHQYVYDSPPPTLQGIRDRLAPDQLLLDVFASERSTFLLAISAEKQSIFKVAGSPQHAADLKAFAAQIADPTQDYRPLASQLYDTYLREILSEFPQQRVVICGDGDLLLLPFNALLTHRDSPPGTNHKDLPFLLKERVVSRHFSATLFANPPKSEVRPDFPFLGIAPTFSQNNLPHAKAEVQAIHQLFPEGLTVTQRNLQKQELTSLLQHSFEYILFATHAKADTNTSDAFIALGDEQDALNRIEPQVFTDHSEAAFNDRPRSALNPRLTGDHGQTRLYLNEIALFLIQSEIVVLSACETGKGKLEPGEGVLSLAREFYKGGSQSVVSTLWEVRDQASSNIVQAFFEQLSQGESPDFALHKAQVGYLGSTDHGNDRNHPYYWAPFVLSGNTQAPSFPSLPPILVVLLTLLLVAIPVSIQRYGRKLAG